MRRPPLFFFKSDPMLQLNAIQEQLLHLVGWRQGTGKTRIDSALTASESGLTFQAAHPLVTLDNILSIMPEFEDAKEWDDTEHYSAGDAVRYNGTVYVCIGGAISGLSPTEDDAAWMDALSWFVRNLTVDGITTAVQTFIQQKQLQRETRSLVDRRAFFDGAARLAATIKPTGKLVGFEIVPVRAMGVVTKVESIGLQFAGGTGTVRLYVFNSNSPEPVYVKDLEYTKGGGFQWFAMDDLYLPYLGAEGAGGAWYICYNQDDLPEGMRALNISRDWSKSPCETCYGYAIDGWKQITKYMQVTPFCIKSPSTFQEYPEMPDIAKLCYTTTVNYGLNAVVSVGCDLTEFIISQRAIFATLVQKQVAVQVLRTLAMNPDVRVNRNQVNVTREQLLYEVDGNPQGRASGLAYELAQAYKAASLDTRGLARICLQCNNNGVKYGHV